MRFIFRWLIALAVPVVLVMTVVRVFTTAVVPNVGIHQIRVFPKTRGECLTPNGCA